jgi:O-antigen biosynthesis protein
MLPCPAPADSPPAEKAASGAVVAAGKFFRRGSEKTFPRGLSYGPFSPNSRSEPFPDDAQLVADLAHIQRLGFDTVRIYHPPTEAFLKEAVRLGLQLIVGIAWTDHVDFMRSASLKLEILQTVRAETTRLQDHPCVIAFLVGNEIEKTLVRWMGPRQVQRFLEKLIEAGRACAPGKLFSYATYPSTEYLIPRNADFLAVNVYLEQRADFAAYLQRLQHLAGNKPLLISEFGLDTAAQGESAQADTFAWFEKECRRAAIAGTVWFSYTDEWFRGGEVVTRWKFGIVDGHRAEKQSAQCSVRSTPTSTVHTLTTAHSPQISVIICTYNGTATLRPCLESLQRLRHTSFEVLLIDDGSTEDIASIAADFPAVRYIRQEHAGLSAARNLGMREACGEILAYTDDDCLADEDWLGHIAAGFDDPQWMACGGPNIPPAPRNEAESIVAAAPGAPAHVMLNDAEAEHLPGCNLTIRKAALEAIGGFREAYRTAGDDVDVCWRLREAGGRLRFMPGAMVWHHRRRSFSAYLRQQRGYGHAEALLMKDHPQHFGPIGGARWRGAIYGDATPAQDLAEGSIFHGPLGLGLFQGIYQQSKRCHLDWLSGMLWIALAGIALLLGWEWLALAFFILSISAAVCLRRSLPLPPHQLSWLGQMQLLALCWLHPIVREGARLRGMITLGARPSWHPTLREVFEPSRPRRISVPFGEWAFWSESGATRETLLRHLTEVLKASGTEVQTDTGWRRHDLECPPRSPLTCSILTMTEHHQGGRTLTRIHMRVRLSCSLWIPLLMFSLISLTELYQGVLSGAGIPIIFLPLLISLRITLKRHIFKAAAQSGMKPA